MAGLAVLDADVLIGHLDSGDAHHPAARALLGELAAGGVRLAASTITLAEVLVGPVAAGRGAEAEAALDRLGVEEATAEPGSAMRLAELRATSGLRLPDCSVLLVAEDAGPGARVASFDTALREAAAELGVGVVQPPG